MRQTENRSDMNHKSVCAAVPPSIQAGPRVMKVQVGFPVELPCAVRGFPEPTLTWTKDGKSFAVSHDGSLMLKHVGLDDEGTYTCTATNTAGRDEAQVQLLVQGWILMQGLCTSPTTSMSGSVCTFLMNIVSKHIFFRVV